MKLPSQKARTLRNADKLRKNQPKEEATPEPEATEAPADEGSNDAPADDEADDTEQENAPTDEAAAE